jgi:hypothetical protein
MKMNTLFYILWGLQSSLRNYFYAPLQVFQSKSAITGEFSPYSLCQQIVQSQTSEEAAIRVLECLCFDYGSHVFDGILLVLIVKILLEITVLVVRNISGDKSTDSSFELFIKLSSIHLAFDWG